MTAEKKLREFILLHFSLEELLTFCADYFNEVYRNYQGSLVTLDVLARELIAYCERQHESEKLLSALKSERSDAYDEYISNTATTEPIRFWIRELPNIQKVDASKLFNNALGSWQAVVDTPIRKADSEAEANVVIITATGTIADAQVGPPTTKASPLMIRFGSDVSWTPQRFEAVSCRMLGHILGLTYTSTPDQVMSEHVKLESLPLTPQPEDILRVRQIWEK